MTSSKAKLVFAAVLLCGLSANGQESDQTAQQAEAGGVSEEVIVLGETRAALRVRIELAEDALFGRFNEINSNDEFDIHCRLETSTGSRIPHRTCQPNFWRNALSSSGRENLRAMRGEASINPAVFQGEALYKSTLLEEEMKELARTDTQLLNAIRNLYDLTTSLEDFGDDGGRSSRTTARIIASSAEQTLPYDAAVMADVRIRRDAWEHRLSHESFAIAFVFGAIESIDLNCRNRSRRLEFDVEAEWQVPADWESCSVSVEADRGTSFTFFEFE